MGLLKREESPGGIPRKARKAIKRTRKAIESVRLNATEEDLAVSADGLSLDSALEGCSRLTASSWHHDQESLGHVERIAPILSSMTRFLEERNNMRQKTQGIHSRSGDSPQTPLESVNEQMERVTREAIVKNLVRLKDELELRS